jgi:hypothetical protein
VVISPSWFVFVDEHHFGERFSRRDLIINNTTIIRQTREFAGSRRETRDIGGARRQVVVNEGPGVDRIQKVAGKRFNPAPISDVARRTPAPQELRRGTAEPNSRDNSRLAPERPNSQTGRERTPVVPEQPQRNYPQRTQPPVNDWRTTPAPNDRRIAPAPERPVQPQTPSDHKLMPPTGRPDRNTPAPERPVQPSTPSERRLPPPTSSERNAPPQRVVPPERTTPPERVPPAERQPPPARDDKRDKPNA